jgi:hypothetical protein
MTPQGRYVMPGMEVVSWPSVLAQRRDGRMVRMSGYTRDALVVGHDARPSGSAGKVTRRVARAAASENGTQPSTTLFVVIAAFPKY